MQDTKTELSPELSKRVQALAAESALSADQIIDCALRNGLDVWEHEFRLIQQARDEAERGEFATDADLERVRNKYKPEV